MDNRTRYRIEMPIGCPAKLLIPLYASELRKKLASCLAIGADQIRIKRVTSEEFALRMIQGALSGMEEVVVAKGSAPVSDDMQLTVRAKPYSKTADLPNTVAQVIWAALAIPMFFAVVPFVRFIILSFIVVILLLVSMVNNSSSSCG